MSMLTLSLCLAALYGVMLYRGVKLLTFTAVTAAVLVGLYGLGVYGPVGLAIALVLFTPLALLFNLKPLRRRWLTRSIYTTMRNVLPEMNSTEKEALEAGDVWWEAEMFRGKPDWPKLLDFETTRLTAEEQRFLDNETEQLCAMIDDWTINHELKDLPEEVWQFIRDNGFFGMLISKEWGGLGFSAYAQSCVVTKISTRSLTAAVTVMVPNSLGPGELLTHYGTDQQKHQYLDRLAKGKEIPCFALTGPEAGSDAAKLPDTGIVEKRIIDGKEVIGLRLNFNKRYITLAPVATLVGLAFKLYDPEGLLGDPEKSDYGITCALIPHDTPGVEIGRRHYPGAAFMNGPIQGTDVFVSLDTIIGGPEMAGQGWRMLVECLSAGRGISLPAMATASGKGMYTVTAAYANIRRQFSVPIGKFEGVQEAMGRMGGYAYRLEACRNLTASAVDHCAPSVVTAMMKYHMTEMMREVLTDAMDIHSGRGIQMGPRNYLAAAYQAVPVAITVEGANIMTRNLIVFGQGAIRCHPYAYAEMLAAQHDDPQQGLVEFDELFWSHIGFIFNRGVRSLMLALTNGRLARSPVQGEMAGYYRQLERYSAGLAFAADVAMGTLGGALKNRERTSARLGDVLSHLYMGSAVLKYYYDQEQAGTVSAEDRSHARWSMEHSLAEIDKAFADLARNFPMGYAGRIIRLFVQPLGRRHEGPSDRLNAQVADQMMDLQVDSSFAERMSYDVYVGDGEQDPTGRMMTTYVKLREVEPYYEPFLKAAKRGELVGESLDELLADAVAKGQLDQSQADAIREYDALRYDAIQTDDFSKEYLANPHAAENDAAPAVDLRAVS